MENKTIQPINKNIKSEENPSFANREIQEQARSGESMVVYTSRRQTFGDPHVEDFKDHFEIKREFNENYY